MDAWNNDVQSRERIIPEEAGNSLNLMDFLRIALANWYWFVLSVVVCLGLAYLKLMKTPQVYTRTASVMIKEESGKGGANSNFGFSSDLSSFGFKNNIGNEILVFKSYRLMEKVAERLHLDISYTIKQIGRASCRERV